MTYFEAANCAQRCCDNNFGVVSGQQLERAGIALNERRKLIKVGLLEPIRRGWFKNDAAKHEVVRAVRAGGVLTGLNALRLGGYWIRDTPELQVRASRVDRIKTSPGLQPIALRRDNSHPCQASVDAPLTALAVVLRTASRLDSVIALDALRNSRTHHDWELERVCLNAGVQGRRAWELSDRGAGSGIETIFRLWLVEHGFAFATQVAIGGVGIVDFLVGNTVVEIDGFEFHGTGARFHADRSRDVTLKARGYRVLRLSYVQVMYQLEELTPYLLSVLRW